MNIDLITNGIFTVVKNSDDIIIFDKNDNKIYSKNSSGFEEWYDYDGDNNKIHFKNSSGYEWWKEYDKNNNMIRHKNSYGIERWYNSDGDKITQDEYNEINA